MWMVLIKQANNQKFADLQRAAGMYNKQELA